MVCSGHFEFLGLFFAGLNSEKLAIVTQLVRIHFTVQNINAKTGSVKKILVQKYQTIWKGKSGSNIASRLLFSTGFHRQMFVNSLLLIFF